MEISQYGDQNRGKSVEQTMTAIHARIPFGEVLPKVAKGGHGTIVERAGRPQAVMLQCGCHRHLCYHSVLGVFTMSGELGVRVTSELRTIQDEDQLVAELELLGIHFLSRLTPYQAPEVRAPATLLADMVQQPSTRVRQAGIARLAHGMQIDVETHSCCREGREQGR
ncbi:MAG: hypothetical protein H8E35_10460 [Ardenticatenia bacterium]|nr:hypothetical protein [Ardenticatenia bacterium]